MPWAHAVEADGLSLQFSPSLDSIAEPVPAAGPGRQVRGAAAANSRPPFRRGEIALRLAKGLELDRISLQLSPGLDIVQAVAPSFRDDGGPGLRLIFSGGVSMRPSSGNWMPAPQAPSRPDEYPLRSAQALVPQSGSSRQPRSGARPDSELNPQPPRPPEAPTVTDVAAGGAPQAGSAPSAPDSEGVMAVAMQSGSPKADSALQAEGSEGAASGMLGWTIPPIRWGGSVNYGLRKNSNSDGASSLGQTLSSSIRGSSFIYAPWLARVSGGLGFVSGVSKDSSGPGTPELQSTNTSIVGNGNLDLFPISRFPFNANFDRSDSRSAAVALTSTFTQTRLGMRQGYRSEDGLQNASGTFDYSVVTTQTGSQDTVSAVSGNYSAPIADINNSVSARLSVSQRQETGEGSNLFSANSYHTYSPQENIAIQAYSNFTNNSLRTGSGGSSLTETSGQFWQFGTSGSWQPEFEDEEEQPLNLTGTLMYAGSKVGAGSRIVQTQQLSGTTAAYYRFSPNLSVNGSGTLNSISNGNGPSRMLTLVNSGITYTGDPLTFGNFSYNWNTGGNMSWQGGSGNTPSNVLLGVNAGHALARNFVVTPTDNISVSLTQNVATFQNQSTGSNSTLSHGVNAGYRFGFGERFNGSITSGFSDNLTSGATAQHYESLNVTVTGFGQLTQRSSANVNLMFNWTDQTLKLPVVNTPAPGTTPVLPTTPLELQSTTVQRMNLSGNASYNHTRFATIPGLRYTFLFTADTLLRDDRLLGNANAQAQRARYAVDNRLDYRIGLLDLSLSATMNDTGGKKNALLFFQVTRQIGAY